MARLQGQYLQGEWPPKEMEGTNYASNLVKVLLGNPLKELHKMGITMSRKHVNV